jgi:hypothetical protein
MPQTEVGRQPSEHSLANRLTSLGVCSEGTSAHTGALGSSLCCGPLWEGGHAPRARLPRPRGRDGRASQHCITDCTPSRNHVLYCVIPLFLRHSTFLSISLLLSAVNIIRTDHAPRRDACAVHDAPCGAPVIADVTDNRPSSRLSRTTKRTRRVHCSAPGRQECVGEI